MMRMYLLVSVLSLPVWALDGAGRMSVEPREGLVAGRTYTFTFTYTVEPPRVTSVPGRVGQAVLFDATVNARYPTAGHLNLREGTIALWVKSEWAGDDGQTHRFFDCFGGEGERRSRYHLSKMASGVLRFQIYEHGRTHDLDFDVRDRWTPNEWHYVVATWRHIGTGQPQGEMHLFFDGEEVGQALKGRDIRVVALTNTFSLGRAHWGRAEVAEAVLDEVVLLDRAVTAAELPLSTPPARGDPHVRFYVPLEGSLTPAVSHPKISEAMRPGGGLKIAIPRTWTPPQNRNPAGPGFVTATASAGTYVDLSFGDYRNIEWYIFATIGGDLLTPGEWIRITYGDRRFGSPGATIQPFPQHTWVNPRNHLGVWSDLDGDGTYAEIPLENRYALTILAAPARFFGVFAPSTVAAGEPFRVTVTAFDEFRNLAHPPYQGSVALAARKLEATGASRPLAEYYFTAEDRGYHVFPGLTLSEPGVYVLTATGAQGDLRGVSNPLVCTAERPTWRLFWGDLHVHTLMSDGLLTAQESYEAAQVSGLDFAAKSDHAESTTPEEWQESMAVANRNNRPGEFVTLLGYEWTSRWGHRNVYTPEPKMPEYSSADPASDTVEELFDLLRGKNVVVIPHASIGHMRWPTYDETLCRLLEIYSMWGSSEYRNNALWDKGQGGLSAREILAQPAKVGFIASSDTHDGRPGRTNPLSRFTNLNHRGGLVAVWAEELTRASLFAALRARRAYGTTGERIYVEFRVNGRPMGSETTGAGPPEIAVRVIGTADLLRAELIRDGRVIYAPAGKGREMQFAYRDLMPLEGEHYYYLRVRQTDGAVAWASPVWVRF